MTRREDLKKLIHNHTRRLQILKEQKALEGRSVDPRVLIEIEDIEAEVKDLMTELAIIESRLNSSSDEATICQGAKEDHRHTTSHILIVEDEPDFLKNLSLTLELEGYQIIMAHDGAEALTMLRLQPVDLILSDISMPGMSGYQLYNRICENPKWVTIPFIFLSARSIDSDIYYGKELGVDDYLTKPIRAEHLLSAVRGKLRRRRATGQLGGTVPSF